MDRFFGKIRPQATIALVALLVIAMYSLRLNHLEVTGVAAAGIIALAKDVLQKDNND
tara:strand:- start:1793 stop:1963 length:171 start_codon:yes stop_codon:yes gene_type:complete